MTWLGCLRRYLVAVAVANLAWEIAQLPLYTIWIEGTVQQIAFAVLHCTVGDLLIASASLLGALLLVGHPGWPADRYWRAAAVAVAAGIAYTVFSEWLNVEVRGNWAYRDLMPRLPWIDTGMAPFMQWLLIPLSAFAWLRRTMSGNV